MRVFGLIGKTLTHSFSKNYFIQKFKRENILDAVYKNFELNSIEQFPELLKSEANISGLNVTIPYKEGIVQFLHHKNDIVREIGACNCIKLVDEVLYGYNTDVIGFKGSLEKDLKRHHTEALILGTGGSSKAVEFALKSLGIAFKKVSRSKKENNLLYNELTQDILSQHLLIINTTPVGQFPNTEEKLEIPFQFLTSNHLIFDLVYNPSKTALLKTAEEKGAQIKNGYEMLELQAEENWRIWNS